MTTFTSARRLRLFASCMLASMSMAVASPAFAATRYWVGYDTDHTRWESPANWSNTSGGAGGQSVPTIVDTAIFDKQSGGYNGQIRSAASVYKLELNSTYTGSVLQGTGVLTIGAGGFTVGSGTFVGGPAKITLSGSYTQTGGIVKSLMNTFVITGSLSITRGATLATPRFTSTGTIVFAGAADQTFRVANTSVSAFRHITLNNRGGTTSDDIVVTSSGALAMSGTLTITLGNLDLATNDTAFKVQRGITIADAAQATFTTDANVTASGSITTGAAGTFSMTSTSVLRMYGVNQQSLDINNASLYGLTVASSGVTLTSDAKVFNALNINTGATLALSSLTLNATGATVMNYGTIILSTGKLVHSGSVINATASYAEESRVVAGGTVYFQLTQSARNLRGNVADTGAVVVSMGSDSETVTLTETSKTSGIFRGSIGTTNSVSPTASNSIIESLADDTITVTYSAGPTITDTVSYVVSANGSTGGTSGTSGGGGGGGGGSRRSSTTTTPPVVTPPMTGTTPSGQSPSGLSVAKQKTIDRLQKRIDTLKKRRPGATKAINMLQRRVDRLMGKK